MANRFAPIAECADTQTTPPRSPRPVLTRAGRDNSMNPMSWLRHIRVRARHRVCVAGTTMLAITGLLGLMPVVASAGSETFCGASYPSNGWCSGNRHSLRQVQAFNLYNNSYWVGAGASWDGSQGNMHGSYIVRLAGACHSYSGANLLYPLIRNFDSSGQSMFGVQYYGSEPACSF